MLQSIMKIFITVFILLSSFVSFADDISDFKIESFSLGDSLLDNMTINEIKEEIELNKSAYNYLREEFGEVYLFSNFENYYSVSFFVHLNDTRFIIQGIRGHIDYDNKSREDCILQKNEIINQISPLFEIKNKTKKSAIYEIDPSGKSKTEYVEIFLTSGGNITISCTTWEKNFKVNNNYMNSLNVSIYNDAVQDWLVSER